VTGISPLVNGREYEQTYLVGTGDDPRELAFLLILTFDYRFDDGGMIRPKIDEAMRDSCLVVVRM
jgi:hypothetical protein